MRRPAGALALAVLLAAGTGCRSDDRPLSPSGWVGAELTRPLPKPEFTLRTTAGEPYDFRRETADRLTLLFFGYTNCPDVCPLHLANIAAALRRMPDRQARQVTVVFVTTDPARDTPEVIRRYLDAFDRRFVGLTGSDAELRAAQVAAGVLPAQPDTAAGDDYAVGHAAQVIAYTPDNLARVMYPFGTRQADWAHDLPLLLQVGRAP